MENANRLLSIRHSRNKRCSLVSTTLNWSITPPNGIRQKINEEVACQKAGVFVLEITVPLTIYIQILENSLNYSKMQQDCVTVWKLIVADTYNVESVSFLA